jgi:hypothetical protein
MMVALLDLDMDHRDPPLMHVEACLAIPASGADWSLLAKRQPTSLPVTGQVVRASDHAAYDFPEGKPSPSG